MNRDHLASLDALEIASKALDYYHHCSPNGNDKTAIEARAAIKARLEGSL